MFITRATRHDRPDVEDFLEAHGRARSSAATGTTFFARDGGIVGCVRLVEVEPSTVVVEDHVVDEARRGEGIGTSLMQAAMNSRGGSLYVRCHRRHASFYEGLGFVELVGDDVPAAVREHMGASGDPEEPVLKAR